MSADAAIMLPLLIVSSLTISQNNAFQLWPFAARSQKHNRGGGTFSSPQQPHLRRKRRQKFIEIPTDYETPQYPVEDWVEFEIRFLDMIGSLSMSMSSMSMVSGSEDEVCTTMRRRDLLIVKASIFASFIVINTFLIILFLFS
jgi:hypothetical protein